jgi:hypothetical protein
MAGVKRQALALPETSLEDDLLTITPLYDRLRGP